MDLKLKLAENEGRIKELVDGIQHMQVDMQNSSAEVLRLQGEQRLLEEQIKEGEKEVKKEEKEN